MQQQRLKWQHCRYTWNFKSFVDSLQSEQIVQTRETMCKWRGWIGGVQTCEDIIYVPHIPHFICISKHNQCSCLCVWMGMWMCVYAFPTLFKVMCNFEQQLNKFRGEYRVRHGRHSRSAYFNCTHPPVHTVMSYGCKIHFDFLVRCCFVVGKIEEYLSEQTKERKKNGFKTCARNVRN